MEHHPLKPDADTREHLVVIGNGMAGCRAVEELLARDPARYRVTIFGAEPRVNYNRIMLSPVLAGEKCFDDIVINDGDREGLCDQVEALHLKYLALLAEKVKAAC